MADDNTLRMTFEWKNLRHCYKVQNKIGFKGAWIHIFFRLGTFRWNLQILFRPT